MNMIKKCFNFIGSIFLGAFNIICSSIIIAVNIFVSFNHTLILFASVGWTGSIGLAATIGCELAFVQASVSMILAGLRKRKPSFPIVFVFSVGTGLVMWSNILSTLDSPTHWIPCVLLGLVPPMMMWGSKGIFSDTLMEKNKENISKVESFNTLDMENHSNMETPMENSSHGEIDNLYKINSSTSKMERQVNNISNMETTSKVEVEDLSKNNLSTPTKVEWRVESVEELEIKDTPTNTNKESYQTENGEIESPTPMESIKMNTPAKNNSSNMDMENHTPTVEVEKKKVSKVEKKKSPAKMKNDKVEVDPIEWALSYHKEYGELPGRKKIIEGARCTEWQARKTLTQLKKLEKAN